MKRVMRWMFHVACAVSLLLCLGSAGMWVRGCWVGDAWGRFDATTAWSVLSGRGVAITRKEIQAGMGISFGGTPGTWQHNAFSASKFDMFLELETAARPADFPTTADCHWECPGLLYERWHSLRQSAAVLYISYAWIVPVTAVLPAWWGYRFFKLRRRFGAGTCQKCGYDLRASTERCPECGTAVART